MLGAAAALSIAAGGCGARTPLSLEAPVVPPAPPPRVQDDPCPFAVLAGAPKPMARYCSTCDGRARASAPRSPHVTWTLPAVPMPYGQSPTLTTDASNHAYIVDLDTKTDQFTLRGIDAGRGTLEWNTRFAPGSESQPAALHLQSGPELVTAMPPQLESFDVASGGVSDVRALGLMFATYGEYPAIAADGSLYVMTGVDSALTATRVAPDGIIRWTSTNLTGVATPSVPANRIDAFSQQIALGLDGTVLVGFNGLATPYAQYTVVVALDPNTGGVLWQETLDGQTADGPVVAPDGSIAVMMFEDAPAGKLVVLEPTGKERRRFDVPAGIRISGVARDGTYVVFGQLGGGIFAVEAVTPSGNVLWQKTGSFSNAFVTSDNSVMVIGEGVSAFDLTTGAALWSVAAPDGSFPGGVCDAALTSAGGVVAIQCNGTVFGAAD